VVFVILEKNMEVKKFQERRVKLLIEMGEEKRAAISF